MTVTLKLMQAGRPTMSHTVSSGASISVAPSTRVQILVNGQAVDQTALGLEVNPPDLTLTLPDGQILTLEGFVDVTGQAGGSILPETTT